MAAGRDDVLDFILRRARERGMALAGRDGSQLTGWDADLVAAYLPWAKWEDFLRDTLAIAGWRLVKALRFGHLLIAFTASEEPAPEFLQLDLHRALTARGVSFVSTTAVLERAEVVNGVLTLDSRDQVGLRATEHALCHGSIATWLAAAVRAMAARPGETLRVLADKLTDTAGRLANPPGQLWVLSGPDGAGKSALVTELGRRLPRRLCTRIKRLHTRPFIIGGGGSDGGGRPQNRRPGRMASLARLVVAGLDFALGRLLIWCWRAQGAVVLADRWAMDYRVDPVVRGIDLPDSLVALLSTAAQRPNGQVVLLATTATLARRKGELSAEEAATQLARYRALGEQAGALVLETDEISPEEAGRRVIAAMLEAAPCG